MTARLLIEIAIGLLVFAGCLVRILFGSQVAQSSERCSQSTLPATQQSSPAPNDAANAAKPVFDPTDSYVERELEGWRLLVNKRLLAEPELSRETTKLLGHQLYQITRVVPAEAVAKLRKVRIWVELADPHHPCMCYHPDVGWLKANGMNPDKARCVELANARTFLKWTIDQPWMVLHELAHAYHDQFIDDGYRNAALRDAHRESVTARKYDQVRRVRGELVSHYAKTNPMEYFAEATEAYFGCNDFFPFVRGELKHHDPAAYELVKKLWGVK